MKITLLGTGSPMPDPHRAGPSTLVQAGNQNIVVDCGRGCVMRIVGAGLMPPMVTAVVLTHLHSDHISDLNDIVTTKWIMSPVYTPLVIVGPVGTKRIVDGLLMMLGPDEGYRLDHHRDLREGPGLVLDVREVTPGDTFQLGDVTLEVHRTDHRPVSPTIGYRISHEGKVAALAGDTIPCAELDALVHNADVYVQTVLREDLVRTLAAFVPPLEERFTDILDYHSTVQQAGDTAARNGVKKLMLTHYVPTMQPGSEEEWRALAAEHFAGEIILGPDLTSLEV